MVVGIDKFKEFFKGYEGSYIVIGGTACDIITENAGFEPRATDDIDIVLIVEGLTPEFIKRFWEFVQAGQYNTRQKAPEQRNNYRFSEPQTAGFPKQIELFGKASEAIDLFPDAHLTPIPVEEGLSNLSAILLDGDYYQYVLEHSTIVDDVHLANIESIICLKAYAYLDNLRRKAEGQDVKTRDIVKHKNDIFRMAFQLPVGVVYDLPDTVRATMKEFVTTIKNELPDAAILEDKGFGKQDMKAVFDRIVSVFNLTAPNPSR